MHPLLDGLDDEFFSLYPPDGVFFGMVEAIGRFCVMADGVPGQSLAAGMGFSRMNT